MIIICPQCETKYRYDEARFGGAEFKKVKCTSCAHTFEVENPLPRDERYSLAVIAGTQAGSVFPITKPRIYIGRGSAMDIQVKDSEVSRRHAMIEIRPEGAVLLDLGATNGTWVGGERVDQAELANQNEFTVGSTTLMLIVTSSTLH